MLKRHHFFFFSLLTIEVEEHRGDDDKDNQRSDLPVAYPSENALVFDTLRLMAKHHIHRVPVVDADKRLVGIVNISDAMMLLTTEQANVAEVLGGRRDGSAE